MKWVVGLDLRPHSQGAIRFADWLAKTSKASDGESLVGVHVLEEDHLRVVLRYSHMDAVMSASDEAARSTLSGVGAQDSIKEVQVVRGMRAEDSLAAARVYHHADGIIVGRQAKRDSNRMVRLGRVARRLLRSLPAPIFIVPPDASADDFGEGPVVAMTNLSEDSVAAARFAADFAARLGRKLVLVHVIPFPEEYGSQYLPAESLDKMRKENQAAAEAEMEQWVTKHGLADAERVCVQGQTVEHAIEVSKDRHAPLLVVGSRGLSTLERMLLTSIATEVCAVAPLAVAVVPPPES